MFGMKRFATIDFGGPSASCLAAVSWPLAASGNKKINVLKIEDNKGSCHYVSVSWSFASGDSSSVIRLNGKFGELLGLKHGDSVTVSQVQSDVPAVQRVQVRCESEEDWEILEPNAESMTNNLLNQLRVVYPSLRFPFWVSKSLTVNLCVDSVDPSLDLGVLETFSEIIIPSAAVQREEMFTLEGSVRCRIQPVMLSSTFKPTANAQLLLENVCYGFVYRADLGQRENSADISHNSSSIYAKITPEAKDAESRVIKIFFIESLLLAERDLESVFPHSYPPRLFLHPKLVEQLNLCKSYVSVEQLHGGDPLGEEAPSHSSLAIVPAKLTIQRPFGELFDNAKAYVEAALNLNHGNALLRPESGWMLITGKSGSGKSTFAYDICKDLEGFPYYIHHNAVQCSKLKGKKWETVHKELESVMKSLTAMSPSVVVLDDLDVICPCTNSEQQSAQEALLHYRMCETIYECMLSFSKYQVAVICTARTSSSLHEYWRAREGFHLFQHCVHIPPPNPLERLDIFQACLRRYQCGTETASTSSSANESIPLISLPTVATLRRQSSQDAHRMDQTVENKVGPAGVQSNHLTSVMHDALSNLHDDESTPKTIHNIAKKWALISSTEDFTSLSAEEKEHKFIDVIDTEVSFARDAKKVGKPVKWEDIGGLSNVKRELTKILQWPIKYAKIFDESPIKMPSGILLYGFPGTGKTLVGLSVPSLVSNAKFIHIKGPELLSKYIGASERAVQDLFQRAKDMSPCILFFDEFDSLVPRRGHDSTGVTDRVVNQFLAEMDGIEGGLGKGVYLVAATSRPDLIDPAVLRPGRLDRHLFFSLPDKGERLEIISALGKDLVYSKEANEEILWDEIGHETEGFTGADLHSLLCTAQLEAIQESLSEVLQGDDGSGLMITEELSELDAGKISVGRRHVSKALQAFKPSLPREELTKFTRIYELFSPSKGRKSSNDRRDDNNALMEAGKRVTLA